MNNNKILQISQNPKYLQLVRTRSIYAWTLTVVMMLVYFGYIYLVAFNKEFLAQPIGAGVTTLSIPIGIGVIIFTVIITGIYVRKANSTFDNLTREIVEENQ
jgi:uncharacterized membrane protein (DUF485 family)